MCLSITEGNALYVWCNLCIVPVIFTVSSYKIAHIDHITMVFFAFISYGIRHCQVWTADAGNLLDGKSGVCVEIATVSVYLYVCFVEFCISVLNGGYILFNECGGVALLAT